MPLVAVDTTHSECLELIAMVFGLDDGNVLSAKLKLTLMHALNAPFRSHVN
jgi:hypothetical protein